MPEPSPNLEDSSVRPRVVLCCSEICNLMNSVANATVSLPRIEAREFLFQNQAAVAIMKGEELKALLNKLKKSVSDASLFVDSYIKEAKNKNIEGEV